MSTTTMPGRQPTPLQLSLSRHRGMLIALAVFVALFAAVNAITPGSFSYFEFSFMSSGAATLALAAVGQTLVILTGGFDLSAGAVVSLVNVVLGTNMQDTISSQVLFGLVALLIGGAVGAVNGFFVAFMRLQPIVVTLSSMFIVQGITLLVLDKPGGMIPYQFSAFLAGDAIPGVLPAPVLVIAAAIAVWLLIKNSRFGVAIYAVGGDEEAARAAGIRVAWVKFFTYVAAGVFYGAAGAFITAQTGSADPLVGKPMLLQVFTAVVIGGTVLGGGRGGCVGSIIGAYILLIVVNILLVLNVSAYYSSVAEGVILVLAVLTASLNRNSPIADTLRLVRLRFDAWRGGTLPHAHGGPPHRVAVQRGGARTGAGIDGGPVPSWIARNRELLRYIVPAYVGLAIVLAATGLVYSSNALLGFNYYNSLIVLSSFLVILALGQGAVILTGGLDLSIPWTIGFCGIVVAGLVRGSDEVALWAIPLGLLIGVVIGAVNGIGVVLLGLPPIVITLATNGVLQGLALVYSNGTPDGFSSSGMRWFMTGKWLGAAPAVWFTVAFAVLAWFVLSRTTFGRRIYAVGNSPTVARLSGVGVGGTLMGVYILSGFCSALVGILLAGFSGQASLGMGDEYLLPSIAVVVVGGTLITGGRGHYVGMLGGVLLLTALSTLLAGTTLPPAVRDIIFGLVVLGAVLALRERT